jgi:hypothetical protein
MNTINNIIDHIVTKLKSVDDQKKELMENYGSIMNKLHDDHSLKEKKFEKSKQDIETQQSKELAFYHQMKVRCAEQYEKSKLLLDCEIQHYEFEFNGLLQLLRLHKKDISITSDRPIKFNNELDYLIDIGDDDLVIDEVILKLKSQKEEEKIQCCECCVCYEDKKNLVMLTCHRTHMLCIECYNTLGKGPNKKQCPLCREYI